MRSEKCVLSSGVQSGWLTSVCSSRAMSLKRANRSGSLFGVPVLIVVELSCPSTCSASAAGGGIVEDQGGRKGKASSGFEAVAQFHGGQ